MQYKVDTLDQEADLLKEQFRREIDNRNIQIENMNDEDLERHQDLFEMAELQRLEQQITRVE